MQKHISIQINEFKEELVNLINDSSLPFCVTAEILKNLTNEINDLAKKEYEQASREYNKQGDQEVAPL